MQGKLTWSLRWQILAAMLAILAATLLLYGWMANNLFLSALDQDLASRLNLLARLAQSELSLERMCAYVSGDEATTVYLKDITQVQAFTHTYQLDRLTVLSSQGRVHLDSQGLALGAVLGSEQLYLEQPKSKMTRLHHDRQGTWQKVLLLPLSQDHWLRLAAGSEMFTMIERMSHRRWFILLMGLVLAFLLSWVLTIILAHRLSRLTRAFQALQSGQTGIRISVGGTDEIAFLCRAFNDMAAELEVKTLREQQQHEQRLTELKALSADIAHEIRNPLGAISVLADLLTRRVEADASADVQDMVQRIRQEISRLDRIVSQVLAYARQPKLTPTPLNFSDLQQDLQAADPDCHIIFPTNLPALAVDYAGLVTVLRNLITNAREAAGPKGEVELRLNLGQNEWQFEITDNGPGVTPEHAEQIFQPFFSTKPHGTGLGLAIARNIMEAHGGRLELIAVAQGACFMAILPRPQEA